jgi:DNA gyrase subunit A
MIIRSPVSQVRVAGRNTQGVKLVNLDIGDAVTAVARVIPDDDKEGVENGGVPVGEAPLDGEQPDLPLADE